MKTETQITIVGVALLAVFVVGVFLVARSLFDIGRGSGNHGVSAQTLTLEEKQEILKDLYPDVSVQTPSQEKTKSLNSLNAQSASPAQSEHPQEQAPADAAKLKALQSLETQ